MAELHKGIFGILHSPGLAHGALQQVASFFPGFTRQILNDAAVLAHNLPEAKLKAISPKLEGLTGKL